MTDEEKKPDEAPKPEETKEPGVYGEAPEIIDRDEVYVH